MKKAVIIICLVLISSYFVWFKFIKQGKYVAYMRQEEMMHSFNYIENGEYYVNCRNVFFVKRIPPELDKGRLKKGKIIISDRASNDLMPVLRNYIQTPGWETDFEYVATYLHQDSIPLDDFFHKFVKINGKNYNIRITQPIDQNSPLDILIWDGHTAGITKTYLEAVEKAKNSCPDPQ